MTGVIYKNKEKYKTVKWRLKYVNQEISTQLDKWKNKIMMIKYHKDHKIWLKINNIKIIRPKITTAMMQETNQTQDTKAIMILAHYIPKTLIFK